MKKCRLGTMPSLDFVRGKDIQKIQWQTIVHPIMCDILGNFKIDYKLNSINQCSLCLDKSTINDHTSAIILSPNLVLCCGKDGLLRLFRNSYEVHSFVALQSLNILLSSTIVEHFILDWVQFK